MICLSLFSRITFIQSNKNDIQETQLNPQEDKTIRQFEPTLSIMQNMANSKFLLKESEICDAFQIFEESKMKMDKLIQNSTFFSIHLKEKLNLINQNLIYGLKKISELLESTKKSTFQIKKESQTLETIIDEKKSNPFEDDFFQQKPPNKINPLENDTNNKSQTAITLNPFDEYSTENKSEPKILQLHYHKKTEVKKQTKQLFIPISSLENKNKTVLTKKTEKDFLEFDQIKKYKEEDFFGDFDIKKQTKKGNDDKYNINLI